MKEEKKSQFLDADVFGFFFLNFCMFLIFFYFLKLPLLSFLKAFLFCLYYAVSLSYFVKRRIKA